ncbi:MAG: tetratricopeptide repeat protein [Nitrospirae bacterium]|nr:tetratricopeptide repeat protein [Nitrospirota bacterium]
MEYRTERSNNRLKEASDVLGRIQKQALSSGIRNFDLPAGVLVQEGEEAFSKGRMDEAVELGGDAVEWAPDDPNGLFFLAKARFRQHPFSPVPALGTYFHAFSAGVDNFWFMFYMIGRLVLILFAGLLGGFIIFFALLMVRYLPRLVHSLHERLSRVFNSAAVWVLAVSLLLMPLFVGVGGGFVFLSGLCLVWLYMSRSERIVASLFVVTLSLSAFWMPVMLSWFTADQSAELVLLSRVIRGEASATGAARTMEEQGGIDGNWSVLFSLAIQKRWEGKTAEALERYQQLRKLRPDQPGLLNNIGNIYFLMKQYEDAVTYYKQSLAKDPRDAVSHYNLNLVSRELLRFNEAKQELEAAEQIDLPLVQSYHGPGPIDELFSGTTLWKIAFAESPVKEAKSRGLFGNLFMPLSLDASPILLVLFACGVVGLRLVVSRKFTATGCALCGRAICFHCQRRILDIKTCNRCWNGSKNVRRKTDLRQIKIRQRWIHQLARWISVFFPGAGHFYIGWGARGFVFLATFTGLVFTVLFRNRFFQLSGVRGGVLGFGGFLAVLSGLAILYFQVFRDLIRASHEKS